MCARCDYLHYSYQFPPAAGKVDEAFGVLYKMVKKGNSPNLITYNSLIIGILKTNKLEEALRLLQVMHTNE